MGSTRSQWRLRALAAAAIVGAGVLVGTVGVNNAHAASAVTYSATQTIPVPPASAYQGSGGGDGWGLAMSSTAVYNVFHHSSSLTVACHQQNDASSCWSPETITDANGAGFATAGHPGIYLDQSTEKLYVYATRATDSTGGVVCIDTNAAATNPNPFCGFTALTASGESPIVSGISALSMPLQSAQRLYAFNYAPGLTGGAANRLLCFDLATHAACASQPFAVPVGAGTDEDTSYPEPAAGIIDGRIIVPITQSAVARLGCFDTSTNAGCAGKWPVDVTNLYSPSGAGGPFPLPTATSGVAGFCLPSGAIVCFDLSGASITTPAGMSAAITSTSGWNSGAVTLGPRVYVPNGNAAQVQCYDAATGATCTAFPKQMNNLALLYTVNADPARPSCLWVNADGGTAQIQNFDAYTGQACGQGPIRVLASSFVVPTVLCQPATYTSLQVISPAPSSYTSASVAFQDADAAPIPGLADAPLDATGTVNLAGKNLSTATGLPQFLITITGASGAPSSVQAKLTWTGTDDPSCVKPGTTVTGGSQDSSINYVALGDSFSSGEGNPPWLSGSNVSRPADHCHRSTRSYPVLLSKDSSLHISSFTDRACSGATSRDVLFGNPANHEDSQLNHLSSSTNLVTISVGGNDINFADVLLACINGPLTHGSTDCKNTQVFNEFKHRKTSLDTYEHDLIANLTNDNVLCETSSGYVSCSLHALYDRIALISPKARIIIQLYPHLFTNTPADKGCSLVGKAARISKRDMEWINSGVDDLDAAIIRQVTAAKADGVNIDVSDPRAVWGPDAKHGAGHGACSPDPWLYGVLTRDKEYSFHPTITGQAKFYAAMKALIQP